jgi:CrcB protein
LGLLFLYNQINKELILVQILWVGLGGFLGAVLRFLMSNFVQLVTKSTTFPLGTLVVNVLGSFVIGLLSVVADSQDAFTLQSKSFVFVGILGAFTTFSTFGNESFNLFQTGNSAGAIGNIGLHIFLGLSAVYLGRLFAQTLQ